MQNEVLLAASSIRSVTTTLPVSLILRTVPIHSRQGFRDQFAPTKASVKGWTYVRQGVYWCARAFDKGAKGGKDWKMDIEMWRARGRGSGDWSVPAPVLKKVVQLDRESSSEEGSEFDEGNKSESEVEAENHAGPSRKRATPLKRARHTRTDGDAGRVKKIKVKKRYHQDSSHLPSSVPAIENLPTEPYERALRLLHVGATPESLPRREEEFGDVLTRVEEGVETGGGGCLCQS